MERRAALVEIAKRWSRRQRIYLIEDAAYRELRYEGDDVPSLRAFDPEGDTVLYAGTFSKSFSPGIRVGWGVLPKGSDRAGAGPEGEHRLRVAPLQSGSDGRGDGDGAVRRARRAAPRPSIAARSTPSCRPATSFLRPIEGVGWVRPSGGLYLWLRLPEGIDAGFSGPLFERAVAEGVLYVPGKYCYPAEGRSRPDNRLRLSFGCQSREGFAAAWRHLARAIRTTWVTCALSTDTCWEVRADVLDLLLELVRAVCR